MAQDEVVSDVTFCKLQAANKTYGKEVEMKSDDSLSKVIDIDVDLSKTHYGLGETGRSKVTTGKQGMRVPTEEKARRQTASIALHISKVPERIRAVDDNSYKPQYVSIGPCHLNYSSPRIEEEKVRCVRFLQSLAEKRLKGGLTGVTEKLEPWVRACYPDGVGNMTPKELSRMLLHDGCFLLCCMVSYVVVCNTDKVAHSSSNDDAAQVWDDQDGGSSDDNAVVRDTVFLIENQIPLYVLEKIHERVKADGTSVVDHLATYVQEILQHQLYISKKPRPVPKEKLPAGHLLHLVHDYFRPTTPPAMKENKGARRRPRTGRWRRAMAYRSDANVWFKRRDLEDEEESSVLDMRLKRGTLWIPPLRVDSMTWTVLRNLMALEEQMPRRPVTAYCVFLSQVAGTVEDVQLLQHAEIVEILLASDEEVAQGFAGLCKGVVMDVDNLDRNYLKPVWYELEERCHSQTHRFVGWLSQHKWIALAFALAVFFLACQVIQTFYAVTAYGQLKHQ